MPRRAAPRFPAPFALCAAVCAFKGWGGVCTRQSPLKRVLRRLWAMCEKSVWIRLRRWRNEPLGRVFFLLTMPCSRDFRPLFTRSIVEQDKGPQSQAPAARPQSPAVRGFPRFGNRSLRCTLRGVFAVFGEHEGRQTPVTADFSRWTFRRRLRKSQFSTTQKSDFQVRAIFSADRTYFAPQ